MNLDDLFASLPQRSTKTPKPLPPQEINSNVRAAQVWNFFVKHIESVHLETYAGGSSGFDPEATPLPCEDVDTWINAVKEKLNIGPAAVGTLKIMMASAISLYMDGPFIWTHICGGSSSLKTTFIDMLAMASNRVFTTNEFTSFFSGSQTGGKNNSMLARVQNKVFCIRDLTPILNMKSDVQSTVFGQFRAIYDGTGEKFYNNGVEINMKGVRLVCITGVTPVVYKFMRTDMGERFMIVDINHTWEDDGTRTKYETDLAADGNAYDNLFETMANGFADAGPALDNLKDVRRLCWGLFDHLIEYMQSDPERLRRLSIQFLTDRSVKAEIDALAVWTEHARCPVPGKNDDMIRATPAEPHRSIKILSKAALALAILHKAEGPSPEIKYLIRKWAFDTAYSYSLEVMNFLAVTPLQPRGILASKMKLSTTHVARICDHLISIGVLDVVITPSGVGQPSQRYRLSPKFRFVADVIGLKERSHRREPPASTVEPALPASLDDLFQRLNR